MRHLLALPVLCATLAACAAPVPRQPGGRFTLEPGQLVEVVPGVSLRFEDVDDSRCPPGVRCVWAGKLSYRFAIRRGSDAPEMFTLSPGEPGATPAALGARQVILDQATIPAPPAPGTSISYRATISILPSNLPTTP